MARRVGKIDVLLNAAGFVHHGTILDCSDDDWDFSFDLNVKSMHRTIKAFLPAMLESGGGSIVNISSAAGVLKAAPNRYVYGATKAAVAALTRSVASDFVTKASAATHLPRHDRDAVDAGARRAAGPGGREMFVARQTDGPARHGRGNRVSGALSRKRRERVHDRCGPCRSMAAGRFKEKTWA